MHPSKYLNFFNAAIIILSTVLQNCTPSIPIEGQVLINHMGYEINGSKKVIFQSPSDFEPSSFHVLDSNQEVVYEGKFEDGGQIDQWHTGKAYVGRFDEINNEGVYSIKAIVSSQEFKSETFSIGDQLSVSKSINLLLDGFESQHPVEKYEEWDKQISFHGERSDKVDLRGGWYDASGDVSKYLSHLSYANYMNPQQTPIVVWNMLHSMSQPSVKADSMLQERLLKEATYGADFLVRMLDPEGYFYLTIFDTWSKDPTRREICAYVGQDGKRSDDYQAAFREGGGMTIAALARISQLKTTGSYDSTTYLETARIGFEHLLKNNLKYVDDGKENTLDFYCALMPATELFAATKIPVYQYYARNYMMKLIDRISEDEQFKGWWRADDSGERPYFHAAEAGLPIVALCRFLEIEGQDDIRKFAIDAIKASIDFELTITSEVYNPFGYPRQYVKATNEESKRSAFFIPHQNESGYWWQGENARLGSLISASQMALPYLNSEIHGSVKNYSDNLMNWLLGLNPYDMCMVEGYGRNNPAYREPHNWNYRGGVCNGITAGFENENDIAFMPEPQASDPAQKWRWSEQWIPHSAWFMLALSVSNN